MFSFVDGLFTVNCVFCFGFWLVVVMLWRLLFGLFGAVYGLLFAIAYDFGMCLVDLLIVIRCLLVVYLFGSAANFFIIRVVCVLVWFCCLFVCLVDCVRIVFEFALGFELLDSLDEMFVV